MLATQVRKSQYLGDTGLARKRKIALFRRPVTWGEGGPGTPKDLAQHERVYKGRKWEVIVDYFKRVQSLSLFLLLLYDFLLIGLRW